MTYYVHIKGLKKRVDHFQLGPIDWEIKPGTITALVGDNGSGKSTLLKIMMNLVNADSGDVKLFNQFVDGEKEDWKRSVAYLPQTVIGYDAFNGNDLQTLTSRWYPNWDEQLFIKIINELNVTMNQRFGTLSQGMQQKLYFALTIARNTPLLILDEPTTFMDIPSKKVFIDLLTDWMDNEERAIIIASHQSGDIQKLADYLTILRSGKLIGHYEKEQLTESYRSYWLLDSVPDETVAGEVLRRDQEIISNSPDETEKYFKNNNIEFTHRTAVSLEEIITILLTQ